jgi:DNA-binding transcriptional regulator YhcF (GntR family)
MLKKERIYRELAEQGGSTTQRELASKCGVSLNLVNSVIRELSRIGAVTVYPMGLRVVNRAKIAYLWGSQRNLERDVSLAYAIGLPVHEIEKNMPGSVVFTAFSGWRLKTGQAPFDYKRVYVYARPSDRALLDRLLSTLPRTRGDPNTFVMLVNDPHLFALSSSQVAPVSQIFVDIYAMPSTPTTDGFLKDILDKNEHLRL